MTAIACIKYTLCKITLSTKTQVCKCGCVLKRDYVAAINILRKGKEIIATSRYGESKTSTQKSTNARGVGSFTHVGANLLE
ncbi:hypothetical protein B4U84_03320 [Westiellopsis prolifica IICB1]|jgi:putative transposase|nr:hypothetical protein B4U84_03320 [Westiellopsis prolifica IICB1]